MMSSAWNGCRRTDAFARALQAKVVLPRGVGSEALTATDQQVRDVLAHAAAHGVEDPRMLDYSPRTS